MSVVIMDGRVRATWCSSVASIAAPTQAELTGGTDLETYITPDGLDISFDTGSVDTSNLASTYTTMRAGRRKPSVSVTFHHDGTSDTAWNLFPYRTNGYLVVRRGVDRTTAWASGDKVEVYPLEAGEASQSKPAPDSTWDFTVPFMVTSDPSTRAVVA